MMSNVARKTVSAPPGRVPGDYHPESLPTRLTKMDLDDCEVRAARIALQDATTAQITRIKSRLYSTVDAAIRRARLRCDHQFVIETFDNRSTSDYVVICAVVTRTA